MHAKFHREHAQATHFPGWKNETLVNSFIAEGSRIVKVSLSVSFAFFFPFDYGACV